MQGCKLGPFDSFPASDTCPANFPIQGRGTESKHHTRQLPSPALKPARRSSTFVTQCVIFERTRVEDRVPHNTGAMWNMGSIKSGSQDKQYGVERSFGYGLSVDWVLIEMSLVNLNPLSSLMSLSPGSLSLTPQKSGGSWDRKASHGRGIIVRIVA